MRIPEFIKGDIIRNDYDGETDDLLTAGFGQSGLRGKLPEIKEPTVADLRRLSILYNYKSLLDLSPEGGYGRFYGPGVSASGEPVKNDGKVAGREYLAFGEMDAESGRITLMVQIPDNFDPRNACLVAAASSGSRGIYGALPTAGEWALKNGFAFACNDKGTGVGIHDLTENKVHLITGERADAVFAGEKSHFTSDAGNEYIRENPYRFAFKHAHSGLNPEAWWGKYLLMTVKFAFYILNREENFGKTDGDGKQIPVLTRDNTLVIASGISNGGDSAIRAIEQDTENLIDGAAVSEPNLTPFPNERVVIRRGDQVWKYPHHSKSLPDIYSLLNIYQPAANLSPGVRGFAPWNLVDEALCENRTRCLADLGLLKRGTLEEMAEEAQEIINGYGLLPEQNLLQPAKYAMQVVEGICITYAQAYGKFRVRDNFCGFSYAAVDPETLVPVPLDSKRAELLFSEGSGIAPTAGIDIINQNSKGGPMRTRESVSENGIEDMNLKGALSLRTVISGSDPLNVPLSDIDKEYHERIAEGISAVRATGDLRGKPVLVVHGMDDAILPVNHTSRPYAALNQLVEKENSRFHYYEVTNAHHLDMLNAFEGFNYRYIPLHYYYHMALDLLRDHLKNKQPLPPSHVVRTMPRGKTPEGEVNELKQINLPPISREPNGFCKITIEEGTIHIPD